MGASAAEAELPPSSEQKPPLAYATPSSSPSCNPTSNNSSNSNSNGNSNGSNSNNNGSSYQEMHRLFQEKLHRSFLLDDVTPQATVPMIRTALGQFGHVLSVDILADPLRSKFCGRRVVVEMASPREALRAVKEIQEHPFMIKGVPRPVRALMASPTMFPDRPRKVSANAALNGAGGSKPFKWVKKGDPDWDRYNEQKQLAKRHASEVQYLMQEMRKEEEKLAQEQEEKVKENLKKLEEIQSCTNEKTIQRLSWYYDIKCENTD